MPTFNESTFNDESFNGPTVFQAAIFEGETISIEQTVGDSFSGEVISIEQTVEFSEDFSGVVISIEQTVEASFDGNVISIQQDIIDADPTILTRIDKFNWDLLLTVGGFTIPKDQITQSHDITKTSDNSHLLNIRIRPELGVQDITFYQGKSVTLDIETQTGITRVFTGIVDIPDIDALGETINLQCINKRQDLINSSLPTYLNNIGYYSDVVFSTPTDKAQEIAQRLETIPFSLELDSFNNFHLIAWEPKTSPDFILDDADVYRRDTQIKIASAGRIINKINVDLEYRFERNHHIQISYSWVSPIRDAPCLMLVLGYQMCRKDMIQSAVESVGWPLRGSISYGATTPDGVYRCSGGQVVWHNIISRTYEVQQTDASGVGVEDPDGNPIMTTFSTGSTDMSNVFADSTSFILTNRWAQTISEKYSITVQSDQSIAQYGEIEQDEAHGVSDDYDSSQWENYTAYTNLGLGTTYFINRNDNIGVFNTATTVILQRAHTAILASHRDNKVTITRSLWPEIELHHTVELTLEKVATKGKVTNIRHAFNSGTGEAVTVVELTLSRVTGSGSDSTLSVPSRPSDTVTYNTTPIFLQNHFGKDPSTDAAQRWNGFIGNSVVGASRIGNASTNYPASFVVDTPQIPAGLRNEKILTASQNYNVAIRNDSLVWTTNGDL